MKIYVASSWKNERQPIICEVLRAAGHEVYDFREPVEGDHGFPWSQITDNPRPWSLELMREVLAHPVSIHGFGLDHAAMEWADACVMVSQPTKRREVGSETLRPWLPFLPSRRPRRSDPQGARAVQRRRPTQRPRREDQQRRDARTGHEALRILCGKPDATLDELKRQKDGAK